MYLKNENLATLNVPYSIPCARYNAGRRNKFEAINKSLSQISIREGNEAAAGEIIEGIESTPDWGIILILIQGLLHSLFE